MTRRDLYRFATMAVGSLMALLLAVPGVAFVLAPLRKHDVDDSFEALTRLNDLEVGVPRSFAVIKDRQDAWVRYPREPVGSIWLIRQPDGSSNPVIALSAECPHLGCAVNLSGDGKGFLCPCHTSAFDLKGAQKNDVPPRPMDQLDVQLGDGDNPVIRVKYQRFRTQCEEKLPLV
jgi:menaquinol-cytochrome c reductase iron-sulfur subunit